MLNNWQVKNFDTINQAYKEQTGEDLGLYTFKFEFIEFENNQTFWDYLESKNYLASVDYTTPICYGFNVNETDGEWNINIYVND